MNDRLDAYLNEVQKILSRHLPEQARAEKLAELRSHLHLACKDARKQAGSDDDAAREAIRQMGSARVVAEDLIRQYKGFDTKSEWVLAEKPLALAVAISAGFYIYPWFPGINAMEWRIQTMRWSGLLLLGVFGWSVWRSRRWLVRPLAIFTVAWAVLGSLYASTQGIRIPGETLLGFSFAENRPIRKQMAEQVKSLDYRLARGERVLASIRAGNHLTAEQLTLGVPSSNVLIETAYVPGSIYSPSRTRATAYYLTSQAYGLPAEELWKREGDATIAYLRKQRDELRAALSSTDRLQQRVLPSAFTCLGVALHIAFLAAFNWLLLHLSDRRRQAITRRDAKQATT